MRMPTNGFKAKLSAGEFQSGLWVAMRDPVCVEIAAGAGFDWLLFDAEHGPHDLNSLLMGLQVCAAYPVESVVRVPVGNATIIKRMLDLGVQTLLVPMVETAQQARELVRMMRYPPAGIRGVGTALARAARWNRVTDYFDHADAEMCLVVQVETILGLENLEAIANVEGVDAVFIGPADLAASLGHLGKVSHPALQAAVLQAFGRARALGKPVGSLAVDPRVAKQYLAAGCGFLALGTDTGLFAAASSRLAEEFRGNVTARSALPSSY